MSSEFVSAQPCAEQGVRASAFKPLLIALALAAALPALAQPVAVDPADTAFIEKLEDRKVIKSAKRKGDAVIVRGLDPLVGADTQTLIDVATVLLRIHAEDSVTRVEFQNPKGDAFATYTVASGLSRVAKP